MLFCNSSLFQLSKIIDKTIIDHIRIPCRTGFLGITAKRSKYCN